MPVIRILVIRFSAMGDVALLVPVIRSLTAAHANVEVTVVTRPRYAPFFDDIDRVKVFPADVDRTYSGLFGIRDLFRALLRRSSYDYVIDLHDHVRTMMLRSLFRLFFTPVVIFDKGRKEKKRFARKHNKITTPLPHTVERYREAFTRAGLPFDLLPPPYFSVSEDDKQRADEWLHKKGITAERNLIGLAPFAMHASKIWPVKNYELLITQVRKDFPAAFLLFGAGAQETKFFEELAAKFPGECLSTAGQLTIKEEIALMTRLGVMVCVDSSNMHLAALAGVPTLSVWGGTHPHMGFAPVGPHNTIVEISRDELPCRPCSVYGRPDCYVGGFPCLTRVTPELLASQVATRLSGRP